MSGSGTKPRSIFPPRSLLAEGASVPQMTGRAVSHGMVKLKNPKSTFACVSGAPPAYVTELVVAVRPRLERAVALYVTKRWGVIERDNEQVTSVFLFG